MVILTNPLDQPDPYNQDDGLELHIDCFLLYCQWNIFVLR